MTPTVTVVIPVYNRFEFIGEAIASVLEQGLPTQIVVVDDGSTVEIPADIRELGAPNVEWVHKSNGGPASARNVGIARANGAYILFLDDDDILAPGGLRFLVDAVSGDSSGVWAAGKFGYIDNSGEVLPYDHPCTYASGWVYQQLIHECIFGAPCAVLVRTDVVRGIGGFDESNGPLLEDYDLWIRLAKAHPVVAVPERVSYYRLHSEQLSNDWEREHLANLELLRKHWTPGNSTLFNRSIAETHLRFGDCLYYYGHHERARVEWLRALETSSHVHPRSIALRMAKSFIPVGIASALRGWRNPLYPAPVTEIQKNGRSNHSRPHRSFRSRRISH